MDVAVDVSPNDANSVHVCIGTMTGIAAVAPDMGAGAIRWRRMCSANDMTRYGFGMRATAIDVPTAGAPPKAFNETFYWIEPGLLIRTLVRC